MAKARHARFARAVAAGLAALVLQAPLTHALINPHFTPIDLVRQSELILVVDFGPIKDGRCDCAISKVLKGKTDRKAFTLDLGKAPTDAEGKRIAGLVSASEKELGVYFVGEPEDGAAGGRKAFLHLAGTWVELTADAKGVWEARKIDGQMESCWAGGTDMLRRAVEYIVSDDGADVPCKAGASWSDVVKIGHVAGKVASAGAADLDGDGRLYLFVASSEGDRLFRHRDGAFKDVTAERKLQSKSLVWTWLDCNGDGRPDLVSWDGAALSVHVQGQDGAIAPAPAALIEAKLPGCLGLSALMVDGKPGLLVSTDGVPLLLTPGPAPAKARKLVEGEAPGKELGQAAACLAADFDGDSYPDVVQPFEKGGLFYAGKASGGFAAPVSCGIAAGKNAAACTGDFDADGLLDVVTMGDEGCRIWQNVGKGRFVSRGGHSGEIAYIAKPDGIACQACDINNDGRQDIFLAYRSMGAQFFFNRGFRSTGHAHELDLTDKGLLPPAEKGQQAACIADFNGDGAQDMALVLKQGDVYVFLRDVREASPLAIKAAFCGPLTVTGWQGKRCLGAWNVTQASAAAFVGMAETGERKITWQFPDGKPQEKTIRVEDAAVRLLIGKP